MDRLPDAHQLLDHGVIDLEPSGGINDDNVEILFAPDLLDRVQGDGGDVDAGSLGVDRNIDFPADDFELIDCGGAVDVAGDQQHLFPVAAEFQREFSRRGGFAAAVETDQHDDGRL